MGTTARKVGDMSIFVLARHCGRVAPGTVPRSAMYDISDNAGPFPVGTVMALATGTLDYFDTTGRAVAEVPEWRAAVEAWRLEHPNDIP